jgi:hypothetical protein
MRKSRKSGSDSNYGALVLVLALLCLPELALLGFFSAGAVLSFPAEQPRPVDVVVVVGGGDTDRYVRGRDLVLAGYSRRLVLIEPNDVDLKDALKRVPGVQVWDDFQPRNSWAEAKHVRARMEAEGLRSVMAVSEPPHLLRLRYTWGSIFRGSELTYTLIASDPPWWSTWRWWRHPRAEAFVGSEFLKLGYYVVQYRFGF